MGGGGAIARKTRRRAGKASDEHKESDTGASASCAYSSNPAHLQVQPLPRPRTNALATPRGRGPHACAILGSRTPALRPPRSTERHSLATPATRSPRTQAAPASISLQHGVMLRFPLLPWHRNCTCRRYVTGFGSVEFQCRCWTRIGSVLRGGIADTLGECLCVWI